MSLQFSCRALLFDLDGVLVDSTASVGRVWRRWAERHELEPEAVIRTAHGRRSIETIRLWAPHLDAVAENRIVEHMEIEHTRELLSSLPPDCWAVVTSGTRALARSRLHAAGLQTPAVLVSADDVERGKPHPEPWLKAAQTLGAAPADCLVLEDTLAGVESAHAAGMRVIALTTTYDASVLQSAECIVATLAGLIARSTPTGICLQTRSFALPETNATG